MGTYRQTALASVQEGGQVLGLDLRKVLGQDSARSSHALDHSTAQGPLGFPPRMDAQQLKMCAPTCP